MAFFIYVKIFILLFLKINYLRYVCFVSKMFATSYFDYWVIELESRLGLKPAGFFLSILLSFIQYTTPNKNPK